ncbi:MAG: mandelate racemase/muconate lactonizing enzyme family protein [Actinomycetota bacterium]
MKIADVTTFVIGNPPPHHGGNYFIVVKVTTDGGVVGWGEIYTASVGPHTVASMVADVAERWLIGHDPFRRELLHRRILSSGYSLRPDPTIGAIASGIDIACWDIVGKETGRSIADLLGGRVHDRLRTYTYLYPTTDLPDVYSSPADAAARAVEEVELGFTALKFDPAGPYTAFDGHQPSLDDIGRSAAITGAIHEAVAGRADLLFGTHGQFTASGAIRMARAIERFDPLWFEEPTVADQPAEMAKVAAATSIPVATGERLTGLAEFAALARHGAASIWQPNLGRCGGITVGAKLAAVAEGWGCQIAPHLYSGPILGAANIQLAATLSNFLVLEGIRDWTGFHADLLSAPIEWNDGVVTVPTEPGLGVDLDEAVALANPYTDGGTPGDLHLQMHPDPIR